MTESAGPATPAQDTTRQVLRVNLHNIPLLRGLDEATLRQVGQALQIRSFARGSYVLHKGSTGEHLVFLLAGRLQVVDVTEDGQAIGLSLVEAGDYLGELSIIDGQARSASVVAVQDSLTAWLPRPQAQQLFYGHPLVAERVLQRLAAKVRAETVQRAIVCLPHAPRRVFALLDHLARPAPGGLLTIDQLPTQHELAIMANTSRETVSRAMQVLLQQGIVEKDLRRLIVRKPAALHALATDAAPWAGDD